MEINVKALIEQIQNQKTALFYYKNAGVITEEQYKARFMELCRIERLHDKALKEKERFGSDVVITTKYSF